MTDILSEEGFRVQIRLEWERKALAAGWSAPVQTWLRVVERCPHYAPARHVHDCIGGCHGTGTISHPPTPAEMSEIAETLYEEWLDCYSYDKEFLLKSGARVVTEKEE